MTKRITFLIGLVSILTLKANGQEKWSIGYMMSPSLESFQRIRTTIVDKPKLSYNFGVKGKYRFTDRVCLSTGLIVYNKGTRYDATGGYPPRELVNHIWFLSIPLTVDYKLPINKKISINSSAGFIYGRKVWDFFIQDVEGRGKEYAHPFSFISNSYLGFTFGFGPSFKISPNLDIEVKPSYLRQLNDGWSNEWNDSSEVERLNSFLLDVTLWYNLRKINNR
jgi:opacity protein-like surface antigen